MSDEIFQAAVRAEAIRIIREEMKVTLVLDDAPEAYGMRACTMVTADVSVTLFGEVLHDLHEACSVYTEP